MRGIDLEIFARDAERGAVRAAARGAPLAADAQIDDAQVRRNFLTTSACGVCGKASIEAIRVRARYDVAADLRSGALERVLPDWRSAPAPIYALVPSGRHLAIKARVFLDAAAERLAVL